MLLIRGKRDYIYTDAEILEKLDGAEEDFDGCVLLDICPEFGLNIDVEKQIINVLGNSIPKMTIITKSARELLLKHAAQMTA